MMYICGCLPTNTFLSTQNKGSKTNIQYIQHYFEAPPFIVWLHGYNQYFLMKSFISVVCKLPPTLAGHPVPVHPLLHAGHHHRPALLLLRPCQDPRV